MTRQQPIALVSLADVASISNIRLLRVGGDGQCTGSVTFVGPIVSQRHAVRRCWQAPPSAQWRSHGYETIVMA